MKLRIFNLIQLFLSCLIILTTNVIAQDIWEPKSGHIMSKWAREVNPENVLPEYPRPQMKRDQWMNLNGLWDYAIASNDLDKPENYEGTILVPFAIESALSGVKSGMTDKNLLWYRRIFEIPLDWNDQKVLLHFGAVDWEATVYVNGIRLGSHQGGYDPFSFDITDALKSSGKQEVVVSVWDPTSDGTQSRGKQVTKPRGIWYTPVTGIWQTVWIEPVQTQSIASLKLTPDLDQETIMVLPVSKTQEISGYSVLVTAQEGKKEVGRAKGKLNESISLKVKKPIMWSPDNPFLYDLEVTLVKDGKSVDKVTGYFAMRKISVGIGADGHERLYLNNEPLFQYGTLDQGWWPGGLYTAPTDAALKYDIEVTKNSGFNMIRKHVKVESARWYYHCDQLGMLVWQDMPNGDKSADWRGPSGYDGREMERTAQSAHQYRKEWKAIIDANFNSPCIVMWVPFNEAWGQFNTEKIINWTMEYDPSRLVNGPSGGNFFPVGHTVDQHQYPGPSMPDARIHAPEIIEGRVLILGEFGGLGLPIKEHLWQKDKNWGYRNYGNKEELVGNYKKLVDRIPALIKKGLAGAIYTQTTDVEGEVNGLMTYDRAIVKMGEQKMKEINLQLFRVTK